MAIITMITLCMNTMSFKFTAYNAFTGACMHDQPCPRPCATSARLSIPQSCIIIHDQEMEPDSNLPPML